MRFGLPMPAAFGNHGHIALSLLFKQKHPKPATDLSGEGGNDAQSGFTRFDQGIQKANGAASIAIPARHRPRLRRWWLGLQSGCVRLQR